MKTTYKYIIGSIGTLSLLAASPLAFAATTTTVTADPAACSTALVQETSVIAPAHDTLMAAMKSAQATRVSALRSALALSDATARKTAITAANDTFKSSTKSAHDAFETTTKAAREQIQTACKGLGIGDHMMMGMMHGKGNSDRGMKMGKKMGHGMMNKMQGARSSAQ
jgi:hypothetical protein